MTTMIRRRTTKATTMKPSPPTPREKTSTPMSHTFYIFVLRMTTNNNKDNPISPRCMMMMSMTRATKIN
jgi:hypothetical protein